MLLTTALLLTANLSNLAAKPSHQMVVSKTKYLAMEQMPEESQKTIKLHIRATTLTPQSTRTEVFPSLLKNSRATLEILPLSPPPPPPPLLLLFPVLLLTANSTTKLIPTLHQSLSQSPTSSSRSTQKEVYHQLPLQEDCSKGHQRTQRHQNSVQKKPRKTKDAPNIESVTPLQRTPVIVKT